MAKPYQIIKDFYPSPMFETKMKEALTSPLTGPVGNLPGMKIMNSMPTPTTFQQLFNAYVAYIHNAGNGYTWNGSAPGGAAYKILDGETKSTECATFANGFMMLAWAPKPYGLGLPRGDLTLESYSGRDKNGFVSNHPLVGVIGLQPNVVGAALYLWANHKVVKYQNRYYDVMYNASYARLEDMAVYQLLEDEITLTANDAPQPGTYYQAEPSQPAAPTHPGKQGFWFKENPPGQYRGPSPAMPF